MERSEQLACERFAPVRTTREIGRRISRKITGIQSPFSCIYKYVYSHIEDTLYIYIYIKDPFTLIHFISLS